MPNVSDIHYPFSAVIGQDKLKMALLLAACDPALGGVLISGNRGTAKSTLARSLADLLHNKPFVNCPLGVSEDRLLGSLDIEHALATGEVKFSAGLFAQAHGGVLYVDEINLLPDHLIDLLLDVSASGINYLERDGVSHQHAAQFILIGSMNPEEGALRSQLLDRFGLSVDIRQNPNLEQRLAIVEARLAFDADPNEFIKAYAEQQNTLRQQLYHANRALKDIKITPESKLKIAQYCLQAGVEGIRADLALLRAARAHTAMRGHYEVEEGDIEAVKAFVLTHRQIKKTETDLQQHSYNSPKDHPATEQTTTQNKSTSPAHTDNGQILQGDWGEMPVEAVAMGLKRQLDPKKFTNNQVLSTQKKKIP